MTVVVLILNLCLCCSFSLGIFPVVTHSGTILRGEEGVCPSAEQLDAARSQLKEDIDTILRDTVIPVLACDGTPGWRRVAYIDMTNTSTVCPQGLNLTSYSKRTCGLANTAAGCSSTTFSVRGSQYSRVCGRIRGYQVGATGAFQTSFLGIDSYYVGGVSLTHGAAGSRQHIWTFAAGISENGDFPSESCPCDTNTISPPFVGNDYFCESGINGPWPGLFGEFYPDDPLWDGQNCLPSSTCCTFNNPPWFTKTLPSSTTDDIELRICDNVPNISDIPLELIELYVQ